MKKPLIGVLLMLAATMAHADGWRGGDGGWRGGDGGWRGGDGGYEGDGIGMGSALIGGVIGGLVASQGPAYVQPMPAPGYAVPYPAYGGYVQPAPYYAAPEYGGYGGGYGGDGGDDEGDD